MERRLLPPSDPPDPGETSGSWEPTDFRERRGEGAFLKETEPGGEAGEAPVPAVGPRTCGQVTFLTEIFNEAHSPVCFLLIVV